MDGIRSKLCTVHCAYTKLQMLQKVCFCDKYEMWAYMEYAMWALNTVQAQYVSHGKMQAVCSMQFAVCSLQNAI